MFECIAGGIAGSAGILVGHPFDSTKVQMQTRLTSNTYKGTWDALKCISSNSLSTGFMRGLSFPLISYGAANSVMFGAESQCKRFLNANCDNLSTKSKSFIAGSYAGVVSWIINCPVENIKVVLQSQINTCKGNDKFFHGPVECAFQLYKSVGYPGLYKGGISVFFRDVPSIGLQFTLYFSLRDYFEKFNLNKQLSNSLAGAVAGGLSWFAILPIDCVKSQMQADYNNKMHKNAFACIRKLYSSGGVRAFYAGAIVTTFRGFIVNGLTFSLYEYLLQSLKQMSNKRI